MAMVGSGGIAAGCAYHIIALEVTSSFHWLEVFETANFGKELRHEADRAADRVGPILHPSDGKRW